MVRRGVAILIGAVGWACMLGLGARWLFEYVRVPPAVFYTVIVVVMLAGCVIGGLVEWRWHHHVRAMLRRAMLRRRRCPECGYDMRGSPGPRCPECGFTPRKPARRR